MSRSSILGSVPFTKISLRRNEGGQAALGSSPEPFPPMIDGFTQTVAFTTLAGGSYQTGGSPPTTPFMWSRQSTPGPIAEVIPRISESSVVPVLRPAGRPIVVQLPKTQLCAASVSSLRMSAIT